MASYDEVKLEDILHGTFGTYNPNTGENKNADSLPLLIVYEEANSNPMMTGVVTNMSTGRYRWQIPVYAASGFSDGKFYEVWVSGSVTGIDTVSQSSPITSFKASSYVEIDATGVYATLDSIKTTGEASALSIATLNNALETQVIHVF